MEATTTITATANARREYSYLQFAGLTSERQAFIRKAGLLELKCGFARAVSATANDDEGLVRAPLLHRSGEGRVGHMFSAFEMTELAVNIDEAILTEGL